MAINAPTLVLAAAAMSVIARGGIVKHLANPNDEGPSYEHTQTLKFWTAIVLASGGIILIDKWNSDLATGIATLWIVGGVISNSKTMSDWLSGIAKGVGGK